MDIDRITITPEELKKYLPCDIHQEILLEIANNISSYLNCTKVRIIKKKRKEKVYKNLKDAEKNLNKAMDSLEKGKEGFSPEIYSLFIDDKERDDKIAMLHKEADLATGNQREQLIAEAIILNNERPPTLKRLVNSISGCIPKIKPRKSGIEKEELGCLFELMYMECEKANPNMVWYSCGYNQPMGDFLFLCKLACEKLSQNQTREAIKSYLSRVSKPNKERMQQVLKNIGGDVTLAKLWDESYKLNK